MGNLNLQMAKSSFQTALHLFEISNLKFEIALWGGDGRGVVSDQVGLGLEGA
jgi:hypothetical protein